MSPSTPQPSLLRYAADVTPEWLTAALVCSGALEPGHSVQAIALSPIGTGQMADTSRLDVTYDVLGAGPASVVGKFASADDQSRGTGLALRAYEIEVRFYQEVAARIEARVPRLYFADVEAETGWFTLILEDIVGGRQGDQIAACGPDVAAAVLEEMAGLHAPCWEAPDLAALAWLNRNSPDGDAFMATMVSSLLPGFLERYEGRLAPEHAALCQMFVEHLPTWMQSRVGPRTASHGDFRLDNLLFQEGDRRPVVVDWQTLSWAGGSYDVAYFIGGCLSADDRRRHESDLLAQYHESLLQRGVTDYSLDQLRQDTRRDSFGGVLMAIVASMVVQRTERGDLMFLTSTSRHAQHALDVDAPALLVGARD
ncbi:MAG TPA: phosphotransferase [Acidimicrobiales bacterium]|jgi:hypothetical protein|nr:phosphotransferase [Acidimicrobiales bacterium]